jgi:voltage-gated potassium channel
MKGGLTAAAQRLFTRPWFETLLGGLILASVGLTVVETTSKPLTLAVFWGAQGITALFAVELALRWRIARSTRGFLREYWLDLLSITPLLTVLHAPLGADFGDWLETFSLLRIFRLARVMKIARHRVLLFPRVLRRGARELFFASGFVLLAIVFASSALVTFERDANPNIKTFGQAFWVAIYSMIGTEPIPGPPHTFGGNVVTVFVILTGLFTFATVVGTVSAVVADRIRSGDLIVDWQDLRDHLIVCGWSRKGEIIIREYIAAYPDDDTPIVVVAEFEHLPHLTDPAMRGRVQFLNDDFTKIEALEKAGVRHAARSIILADTSKNRKERDADARTILAALTIERLNSNVYTCAEIHRREHAHHLAMGKVNDFVVSGEHSAFLLAQSAITRGVMSVFAELMTHQHGNRFSRCAVTSKWKGKSFVELMTYMKAEHDALLVAVQNGDKTVLNPKDYVFEGGEDIVCIASREVRL